MRHVRGSSLLVLWLSLVACAAIRPGEDAFGRDEYELAARQGHPEAQWLVGNAYAAGTVALNKIRSQKLS